MRTTHTKRKRTGYEYPAPGERIDMKPHSQKIPWGVNNAELRLLENPGLHLYEGMTDSPSCALKYCIFNVRLYAKGGRKVSTRIIRKIQIAGRKSLYNFARVIVQSFNFSFDHCFAFYDNFDHPRDSKRAYELFVDIGEEPLTRNSKGVKNTRIDRAFRKSGERMLFHFDYGDEWSFTVKLMEIRNAEKWDLRPVILGKIGEAPLQYPPSGDE